ncbi:MAG: hypothetical protein DRR08_27560 [Candidatus Parabeggiatoa sp. nov. 2]|nr:MAG: hypothetical protein DRR08_27560 [Gammaproteobacteria bacterium]
MDKPIIGLDWDGTVSDYSAAFSFLATLFQSVVIITLNDTITPGIAANTLSLEEKPLKVEICPDDRLGTHHEWKAEICVKQGVDIMFDDDPDVVLACHKRGIHAITVSEFIYRFKIDK